MGEYGQLPPSAGLYGGPMEPDGSDAEPVRVPRRVLALAGGAVAAIVVLGVGLNLDERTAPTAVAVPAPVAAPVPTAAPTPVQEPVRLAMSARLELREKRDRPRREARPAADDGPGAKPHTVTGPRPVAKPRNKPENKPRPKPKAKKPRGGGFAASCEQRFPGDAVKQKACAAVLDGWFGR